MQENKKFLSLLQVAVPPATAVTVTAEINVLEILGIVGGTEMLTAMQIAQSVIPAGTPATLYGLIALLGNLIKTHPKATKAHQEALSKLIKSFTGVPDAPLTFATFLPICSSLMQAIGTTHKTGK